MLDRHLHRALAELAQSAGTSLDDSTVRLVVVYSAGQLGLAAEVETNGRRELLESADPFPLDVLRTCTAALRASVEEPQNPTQGRLPPSAGTPQDPTSKRDVAPATGQQSGSPT